MAWRFAEEPPVFITFKRFARIASNLRSPPAWPQRAPALRARNPKRVREESESGSPRVPKECAPKSEKSLKRVRTCVFGLFSDSGRTLWGLWGSPGPEAPGHPFGLFSDSFGVPGPNGPGAHCARPGGSQLKPAIRNFYSAPKRGSQKKGSARELSAPKSRITVR